MTGRTWRLSPSDFASLWEECRRCFYLQVSRAFPRPRAIAPGVDAVIDARLKAALDGRRTETLTAALPPGVFESGERWVESEPIDVQLPDHIYRCSLHGTLDPVIKLDDGTLAAIVVVTAKRDAGQIALQARPLHAYAFALEHPAPGTVGLGPVSRLGVLVFEPSAFAREAAALGGELHWTEIPRDDSAFFGFLAEALSVLEQPEPPGGTPLCPWCVYRDASRRTGL